MPNKYETGKYHLLLFDQYGSKTATEIHPNLTQADAAGKERIKSPPHASYVVSLIVTNSLDRHYPWENRKPIPVEYQDEIDANETGGQGVPALAEAERSLD